MSEKSRQLGNYNRGGWLVFDQDAALLTWLKSAGPAAIATRHDPAFSEWVRCDGTWFVGVNALANDGAGAVNGSGPLPGQAIEFCRRILEFDGTLDRAQVSICSPGFPRRTQGESAASFAFRRDRDAAHIDGLHPVGPERRRKLLEYHGFLLGIAANETNDKAAPLVVWDGSHKIMHDMLRRAFDGIAPENWPGIDLTHPYRQARKQVFAACQRRVIHARPGQAYLLHPMAVHGVSSWQKGAIAPPEGRVILYFRPEISRAAWLGK